MKDYLELLKLFPEEMKTDLLAGVLLNLSRAVMEDNQRDAGKLAKLGMLFVLEILGNDGAAAAGSRFEQAFSKAENMCVEKTEIEA